MSYPWRTFQHFVLTKKRVFINVKRHRKFTWSSSQPLSGICWANDLNRSSRSHFPDICPEKKKNFLFTSISCKDIKDAFDWPFSGTGPYSGFFRNSWNNFCFEITRWHVFCLLSTVMSRVLLQISRQLTTLFKRTYIEILSWIV